MANVAATTVFFAAFPINALTGQSLIVSHGWFMECYFAGLAPTNLYWTAKP